MGGYNILKGVFDVAPIGIAIYSTNYEMLDINPMLCKILGYTKDEVNDVKLRNMLYRDGNINMKNLERLKNGEIDTYESEVRFYKKSGEIIWACTKTNVVFDNDISYFVSVVEDITELKRNRNLVKNITDVDSTLISVINKNLEYVYMNKSYEDYFKIKKENYIGKHITEVVDPITYKKAINYISKALSGETCKFDNYTKTINGEDRVTEITFRPYYVTGEIVGFISYTIDITERKMLEDKLKELNATKDKFFSIIAHDLRNAFGGFLGFTEILRDDIDDIDKETLVKISGMMNESANNTYKLLENLLEWSRLQKQNISFDLELVNFDEIISEIFNETRDNANKKDIKLIKTCTDNCEFPADKNMIKSVIRNLITNAIKFTPRNGVIKLDIESKENSYLISVTDTGIGISQEVINNLFKIDNKYTTHGTENEPSTGLGLLLCKEFVNKHNGKIWCESVINKGTTFFVELPN